MFAFSLESRKQWIADAIADLQFVIAHPSLDDYAMRYRIARAEVVNLYTCAVCTITHGERPAQGVDGLDAVEAWDDHCIAMRNEASALSDEDLIATASAFSGRSGMTANDMERAIVLAGYDIEENEHDVVTLRRTMSEIGLNKPYRYQLVGDAQHDTFPWAVIDGLGAELNRYTHRSVADSKCDRLNLA